jgi:hypothetical protein
MKKFKKISDFSEVALDAARILGGYGENSGGGGGSICTTKFSTSGATGPVYGPWDSATDTKQDPCR